jgi:outer membrane murein-binding lipoprotein Lpp
MSLRAQVDEFCKNATGLGKKIEKLEAEVKSLKEKLNASKTAKTKPAAEQKKTTRKAKMTDEEKAQRKREKEVLKELEKRKALGLPPL